MKALAFIFILLPLFSLAQINQADANGYRQGNWKKFFENGKIRYEGSFKDNKPVGEWKRYHDNGNLQAKIYYSETSDSAVSEIYNLKGKLIASGNFVSEKKEGLWKFFSGTRLVSESNFLQGIKHGLEKMYYESGEILEEIEWINNLKHGKYKAFFKNGQPYMECMFKEGNRDGYCVGYFENGKMEMDAFYAGNKRDGDWKHFDQNGELLYTLKYYFGELLNPHVLDSIQGQAFDKLERNRSGIVDPEKFMQNPEEYMMNIKIQK